MDIDVAKSQPFNLKIVVVLQEIVYGKRLLRVVKDPGPTFFSLLSISVLNLKHDNFLFHLFMVENVFDNNVTFVSFDYELISRRHFFRLF